VRPDELNFDGWHERYHQFAEGSEERMEALDHMLLCLETKIEARLLLRILFSVEKGPKGRGYEPHHPAVRMCTDVLVREEPERAVLSWRHRIARIISPFCPWAVQ
jgi:hypothetical protein